MSDKLARVNPEEVQANGLETRILIILAGLFIGSRLCYYRLGVDFDNTPLYVFMQYLDVGLLRTRLLESCWYLHSQPPLFNLFLGAVVKLAAPPLPKIVFQIIYAVFGLILYYSMYRICIKLGVSRLFAVTLSTLFIMSPDAVLYEKFLLYTYPVAALLTLAALLLANYISGKSRLQGLAGFVTLAGICAIWSTFHLLYYLMVAAVIVGYNRRRRKETILLSAIPLTLLIAIYLKNFIVFGFFGASSWMGMNFWGITGNYVTSDEIQTLNSAGKLSAVASIPPFSSLIAYYGSQPQLPPQYASIPALSQLSKPYFPDSPNFNHYAYLNLSKTCMQDALFILRHEPESYAKGMFLAWIVYFQPARNYWLLAKNREALAPFINMSDALLQGWVDVEPLYEKLFRSSLNPDEPRDTRIFGSKIQYSNPLMYRLLFGEDLRLKVPLLTVLNFLLPLLFAAGLLIQPAGKRRLSYAQKSALLVLVLTILYVAVVGNCFELMENNRFRFVTIPLTTILSAVMLQAFADIFLINGATTQPVAAHTSRLRQRRT